MAELFWDEFWWNTITGPHLVVLNVTAALLDNNSVLLTVPADLPWRHSMRSSMNTEFRGKLLSSEIVIESIDIVDDNPENLDPGRLILSKFASSADRKGYRERSKTTIQEYITAKRIIRNRIVWIKGVSSENAEQWIKFCRGFKQRSVETGLFVLEVQGKTNLRDVSPLKLINFSDFVSSHDVQLFNSFVLDVQDSYQDNWKNYIATLSAVVCDTDAEISEKVLETVNFKTDSIMDCLNVIADSPDYARRGENNPEHVLWSCRNNKISELEHRIWEAQVQVLFPLIEMERVRFIEKWHGDIQKALDYYSVYQYSEPVTAAEDVELGCLSYMMHHRESDGDYTLYIPDESDRERIFFLHDCRNQIAHMSCCSVEQVRALLEGNENQ